MLFTPDIDIFGEKLEVYRNCFSKPQWRHFKTYINGLILGERGEKNIQDIISNTLNNIIRRANDLLNKFTFLIPPPPILSTQLYNVLYHIQPLLPHDNNLLVGKALFSLKNELAFLKRGNGK